MHLEIRYLNEFRYSEPARESHNLLRACPQVTPHQTVVSYVVDTTPNAKIFSYVDYWGTRVDEFGVREPHDVLSVRATSIVDTTPPPKPDSVADLNEFDALRPDFVTYLAPSPHTRWDDAIADMGRKAIAGTSDAVFAVQTVCDAVTDHLAYRPGTTDVGVDVTDVLHHGQGVCQDFAHLAIAMYRSVGIPARYVSGYLYASNQDNAVQPDVAELEVQTHAWVEAFIPGHGWWQLDPTNPQPIGELHVKIGHGRDYDDVMPLRGVYHGGSRHDLGVTVTITRDRLAEPFAADQ